MEGVSLQLLPEEPEAVPWRAELLSTVIEAVTRGEHGKVVAGRPVVLAVDGRSNSGKTTLALRIIEGRSVSYRPPRWVARGREGSIDVPAGCPLLVIEGDGAGRGEVAHLIDALIWVQSDEREAERRRLVRDRRPSALDVVNFPSDGLPLDHEGWMAEEIPFNAAQRSWERADIVVCGTPEIPYDPVSEIVVGPPPGRTSVQTLPSLR